jgi:hypothetical protein
VTPIRRGRICGGSQTPYALPLTALHRLELRNAFWLAVFQKRCSAQDAREFWECIQEEIKAGLLLPQLVPDDNIWQSAEAMVEPHTSVLGTRSMDILHLAYACSLNVDEFVTFDQRQSALALRIGLKVTVI